MARIATGSIVADIAGKVGDEIFSRNRQGPYVKAYASPVQPNTAIQIVARAKMNIAINKWNALSDSDYRNWAAFSKEFQKSTFNGSHKSVDPKSFFIGCSINQQYADSDSIPKPIMPGDVGFTNIEVSIPDETHLNVIWRGGSLDFDYSLSYYSTFAHSKSVRSINSVQQIHFGRSFYIPNNTFTLFAAWNAAFPAGFPTSSQRIFISTKITHDASGIQVGFGWDSAIGIAPTLPYNVGNNDIRALMKLVNTARATPVSTSLAGTITGINVHIKSGGGPMLVGIYADNAGVPGARLAISLSTQIIVGNDWQFIPFISSFAASANTTYWLAYVTNVIPRVSFDSNPIFWVKTTSIVFSLPDPWVVGVPETDGGSIFATVT